MNNKQKIGQIGQKIAVNYLKTKGYKILGQNLRKKWGEIDILAKIGKKLVIIEVKTRTSYKTGLPEEAVDIKKQHKLYKMATILEQKYNKMSIQVDILSIILDKKSRKYLIRHIKGIELQFPYP